MSSVSQLVAQLVAMGFARDTARAALAREGNDLERAISSAP